jgi:DNA-binding XRE family transcriptional regulator
MVWRRRVQIEPAEFESLPESLGLRLQSLRCKRGATQASLANQLGIGQTVLSHKESRGNLPLSTLAAYITALGGRVHVAATFPDAGPVCLSGDTSWRPIVDKEPVAPEKADDDQLWLPSILDLKKPPPSRDVSSASVQRMPRKYSTEPRPLSSGADLRMGSGLARLP